MACHRSGSNFRLVFEHSALAFAAQARARLPRNNNFGQKLGVIRDCRGEIRNDDLFGSNLPPCRLGVARQIMFLCRGPVLSFLCDVVRRVAVCRNK